MRRILALATILVAGAARAEEGWQPLSGPQITAALAARHLVYDGGATQQFDQDGSTTYDAGSPSLGRWRVEGDRYCSVWPPSDLWACYAVDRSADGLDLRFTAGDGSSSVGRYDDL